MQSFLTYNSRSAYTRGEKYPFLQIQLVTSRLYSDRFLSPENQLFIFQNTVTRLFIETNQRTCMDILIYFHVSRTFSMGWFL